MRGRKIPGTCSRRRLPEAALVVLSTLLFAAEGAFATAACHCFRDRAFDPARPTAVDPYIVATSQNSFFSAAFGVPKKTVVRAKMGGTDGDDLWIAYYAARSLGLRPGELLAEKENFPAWQEVLGKPGASLEKLGTPFLDSLAENAPAGRLAAIAAAETLFSRIGSDRKALDSLVSLEASSGEIVTAALVARWSGKKAGDLYRQVLSGGTTWGAELNRLEIPPAGIEEKVLRSLR